MTNALVVVLVLLPPVDWAVAVVLTRLSLRYPAIVTLRERAVTAVLCAIAGTIAGILAWVRLGLLHVGSEQAIGLLALALVVTSLPSLFWLGLLLTGRFRIRDR